MPRLSTCFYFTEGTKSDGTRTTRNTDSNKKLIKTSSITYPPETTGDVTYYSEKEKGSGYYNDSGFHTVMYIPAPDHKNLMPGQPTIFTGSIVIQGSLEEDPADDDWVTLEDTLSEFNPSHYKNVLHNFQGNFVWIRAKVVITYGVLQQISLNY
jgi:hypothetical protein